MNREKLLREMSEIDPEYINEAKPAAKRHGTAIWLSAAAALVLVLGLGFALSRILPAGGRENDGAPIDAAVNTAPTREPGIAAEADPRPTARPETDNAGPSDPIENANGTEENGMNGQNGSVTELPEGANGTAAPYEATPYDPDGADLLIDKYAAAQPAPVDYPKDPEHMTAEEISAAGETWGSLRRIWFNKLIQRRECAKQAPVMSAFTSSLIRELMNEETEKNVVCSPANIYIALAMLAETSDGNTRAQILSVLGVKDMAELRSRSSALMDAECFDDGGACCRIANSLWMNSLPGFVYNTDTVERIAQDYRASSFWGDMSAAEYTEALRAWLNKNTGGLLEESVQNERFTPDTVMAIASTLYLKSGWNGFDPQLTQSGKFHAETGDITCDFMHKSEKAPCYEGDCFKAAQLSLDNNAGSVWMLLPDEGVSIEEMLEKGGMDFILYDDKDAVVAYDNIVQYTVPKFDVSFSLDIKKALARMGMTDCFDPDKADFTQLTDLDWVYVGKVDHAARVKADETGIEAGAFTVTTLYGGGLGHNGIFDFTVDRPFVFAIFGQSAAPLFIGVVRTPVE